MKTSTLARNEVPAKIVELLSRVADLVPWPIRRQAMADITLSILDGKPRVAETVFGWNRNTVELGINEVRTGIFCVNDISNWHKPRLEEKEPLLLADIQKIMDPQSQADPRLRTTLLYSNMTAQAVHDALIEKGWAKEALPTVRTISNILNRHGYRLRTVEKTKVQKNGKHGRDL